jgi:hypothetical protein
MVETVTFDWNVDGKPDQFILEKPSYDLKDEQIYFTRLRIELSGHGEYVFENKAGWIKYESEPVIKASLLVKKSLIQSSSIAVLPSKPANDVPPTIFLVSVQTNASAPFGLYALQLNRKGKPYYIFQSDSFWLEAFEDLNGDGYADIVGGACLAEVVGNQNETYNPFHVYSMKSSRDKKMHYSLSMSKIYNYQHYYGWAGPKCSEDLIIVKHPKSGDKPVIMKAEDIEKIFK